MKSSYAVNSKGEVIDTKSLPNIFRVPALPRRTEEIENFINNLAEFYNNKGFYTNTNGFIYKCQPYYTEDRIYFFVKVPLSASSRLVKRANGILFPNEKPDDENVLKSIFSSQEREKTVWYILHVIELVLERNIYDCEWERFVFIPPVVYNIFLNKAQNNVMTDLELKKRIISNGYYYPQSKGLSNTELYTKAAIRYDNNETDLSYCEPIRQAFYQFIDETYGDRKDYGNDAIHCLQIINNSGFNGQLYDLYQSIKPLIKTVLPNSKYIRYQSLNNSISYELDNIKHQIYVRDPLDKESQYTLVLNGRIYNDYKYLINDQKTMTHHCEWYNATVMPYIK